MTGRVDEGNRSSPPNEPIYADPYTRIEWLHNRISRLEEALGEAADWLDTDLAHAPDTPTSMADRDLVASWRELLT